MNQYAIRMREEGGGEETATIEADSLDDLRRLANEATRDWLRGGDWGDEGARVEGWWEALDDEGDRLTDDDGDEVAGSVTVEIEPDHATLIRRACGDRQSRCCGTDPDDHDWSSEGEGGCDSNPGVWSLGGTAMLFTDHCRVCGLHRRHHSTGAQRNPGDHDTTEYTMPERWCQECQAEACDCVPAEVVEE